MRKTNLLHSEISYVISKMGHFDTLTVGDAGLPIPKETQRIDVAITLGVPSFLDVLKPILEELCVQKVTIASETKTHNEVLYNEIMILFSSKNILVEQIPHEEFKLKTQKSKAVVRTGEIKPYANIILESGVVF